MLQVHPNLFTDFVMWLKWVLAFVFNQFLWIRSSHNQQASQASPSHQASPSKNCQAVWPAPPAQGRGQSKACRDRGCRLEGKWVWWHRATWPDWGKKSGCCVSDWWGQVCGRGIGCCRKDVLLALPALSAACLPVLRTRLIGTPNCPYEYFSGEQEWEFRVGGMVSMALTANDPLNDQRERRRGGREEWLERVSVTCMST